MSRVVGIDLGTTHTALASASVEDGVVEVFRIPQLTAARAIEARELLPSVLYAREEGEDLADEAWRWAEPPFVTGEHARRRGHEVPERLVASAKSWLSHPRVDRRAPILPWGAADETPRLSPVAASAAVLRHVARAWDAAHPSEPLGALDVVLTVPASFDEVARALTLEAARSVGLTVRLLEEPQAALHEALSHDRAGLVALARARATVLVVDVGGGTTDLSLFTVDDGPSVRRVDVGDHLLLGGDNMDLALAHLVEPTLSSEKLPPLRFRELVLACRDAKEALFGAAPPERVSVTLLARGARLVGGALRAELAGEPTRRALLDGFFPSCARDDRPRVGASALVSLGLPYARDAAITRHVAAFLARSGRIPTHLFVTGGVFRSRALAEHLRHVVSSWHARPIELLPNPSPDLSVARGAVRHGLARRRVGFAIRAGAAQSYFVGVEGDRSICVLPKDTEPEERITVDAGLRLLLGERARFPLLSTHEATRAGEVRDAATLRPLGPIEVILPRGGAAKEARVSLTAELLAIGSLEVACTLVDGTRHVLAFDLSPAVEPAAPVSSVTTRSRRHDEASAKIAEAFGATGPRAVKDLPRELAKLLGEREGWAADVARSLGDAVLARRKDRRRSAEHERVFLSLAGYCLRPGLGAPRDPERMRALVEVLERGLVHSRDERVAEQWIVAFRRVCPGLPVEAHARLAEAIEPVVTSSTKPAKSPFAGCDRECVDLAGLLERLPPPRRARLGEALVERAFTRRDARLWDAIGRIGARQPSYAGVEHVVPPSVVTGWIEELLRQKWEGLGSAPLAAMRLARATGDRARDVAAALRERVAQRLEREGHREHAERVRSVVDDPPTFELIGEAVPIGLRLD